jgi:DHA3 family macrolide efflux protein-like MFS transporter
LKVAESARAAPAAAPAAVTAAGPARLANRNFLLLWQGQAISQLGNQAFALAMSFWSLEATGSASLMGLLLAATSLPMSLLAPLGGVLADRLPRLRILVACDCLAGAAMMGLGAAMLAGRFSRPALVALLFAAAFVSGVVNAFFQPALSAALPDLVPAGRVTAANSLNQLSIRTAVLIGQGIGGVLFRLVGAPRIFVFDGLTFLYCAGSEALVRMPPRPERPRTGLRAGVRQFAAALREGFAYVASTPGLLGYMAAPIAYNFFTMPVAVLLPFYVTMNLHAGAEWYGFLLAAMTCGSIAGFLAAGLVRLTGRARGRFLSTLIAIAPVPMLVTGFIHRPAYALVLAFGLGALLGLINVHMITQLQTTTPERLRGRVLGLWTALATALLPLGMALGGFAGDLTGKNIPLVFTCCGILTLAVTAASLGRRSTREFLARD